MVIWISGLSGAGKTTLCTTLYNQLKPLIPELVVLDGDVIRSASGNDLTHSESDRIRQVHRLRNLAMTLAEQKLVVLVGVLYANPDLLTWNRNNLPGYVEVYLDASLETAMTRDNKGIYAAAQSGEVKNVVGLDIPWHVPRNPDIRINIDTGESPDVYADQVIRTIPRFEVAMRSDISA